MVDRLYLKVIIKFIFPPCSPWRMLLHHAPTHDSLQSKNLTHKHTTHRHTTHSLRHSLSLLNVFVYLGMYTCVRYNIYTYIYIHIHTYIHTYIYNAYNTFKPNTDWLYQYYTLNSVNIIRMSSILYIVYNVYYTPCNLHGDSK